MISSLSLILQSDLLKRFNFYNKKLQSVDIESANVAEIYQSLFFYVNGLRTDIEYELWKILAIEKYKIEDRWCKERSKEKRITFMEYGSATDVSNTIDFKIITLSWIE